MAGQIRVGSTKRGTGWTGGARGLLSWRGVRHSCVDKSTVRKRAVLLEKREAGEAHGVQDCLRSANM